jgi:hypothetical protein
MSIFTAELGPGGLAANGYPKESLVPAGTGLEGSLMVGTRNMALAEEALRARDGRGGKLRYCPDWGSPLQMKCRRATRDCPHLHLKRCGQDQSAFGGGRCKENARGVCPYWHYRPVYVCKEWSAGSPCRYGDGCSFLHRSPESLGIPAAPSIYASPLTSEGLPAALYAAGGTAPIGAAAGAGGKARGGGGMPAGGPAKPGGPAGAAAGAAGPASASAAVAAAAGVTADGRHWVCPRCTYACNDLRGALVCQMCESSRPQAAVKAASALLEGGGAAAAGKARGRK